MREIVLDTETTGLDPEDGHRIIEVACLELINHVPSEVYFHKYVNPERDIPTEAFNVHGISADFLRDKPIFEAIAQDFLDFVGADPLIIHNAEFDLKFLNAELTALGHPPISITRAVDTLELARRKYPGAQASLDALCRRFEIDNSARTKHGALLDTELLAAVYLELIGGRQPGLELAAVSAEPDRHTSAPRINRPPRPHAASPQELEDHAEFLKQIKDPIWAREVS